MYLACSSKNFSIMPTGYTAAISKGISFEKFTMDCARAFGALIVMRDEPADAPIPDEFQPSDYHLKELEKLYEERKKLTGMALKDGAAKKMAEEEYEKVYKYWEDSNKQRLELKNKYNEMLAKVVAWEPPTADHVGLKDFMVQQIQDSIKWDCNEYDPPKKQSTEEWYSEKCAEVQRSILYHKENHEAEVKRARERSQWVKDLKNSLNLLTVS
jgi:hypothetical protein